MVIVSKPLNKINFTGTCAIKKAMVSTAGNIVSASMNSFPIKAANALPNEAKTVEIEKVRKRTVVVHSSSLSSAIHNFFTNDRKISARLFL